MAKVDMVADTQTGKDDLKGLLLFDSANENAEAQSSQIKEETLQASQQRSFSRSRGDPNNLAIWMERKDTCFSAIYKSVLKVPNALEIAEQYMLGKNISPC